MLDTAEALGSTAEILEAHSIPHAVSKDMRALGLGALPVPAVVALPAPADVAAAAEAASPV